MASRGPGPRIYAVVLITPDLLVPALKPLLMAGASMFSRASGSVIGLTHEELDFPAEFLHAMTWEGCC